MAHLGVGHLEAELGQAVGKQGMHRLENIEHIVRVGQLHKQGVDHISNKDHQMHLNEVQPASEGIELE